MRQPGAELLFEPTAQPSQHARILSSVAEAYIHPAETIVNRFLTERCVCRGGYRNVSLGFPVLAPKSRTEFLGDLLNPIVVAKAGYVQPANRAISRDHEHTTQQLRRHTVVLPRRLNGNR